MTFSNYKTNFTKDEIDFCVYIHLLFYDSMIGMMITTLCLRSDKTHVSFHKNL
jgi:hypothetical protein